MFVIKGILFGMASSTVCYLMFLANVGLGNLRTHDPSDETEDERVQTATKWPHTYIFQMPALSGILPSRNSAPQRRPNHYIQRPYYVGEACIRALGRIQKEKKIMDSADCAWAMVLSEFRSIASWSQFGNCPLVVVISPLSTPN